MLLLLLGGGWSLWAFERVYAPCAWVYSRAVLSLSVCLFACSACPLSLQQLAEDPLLCADIDQDRTALQNKCV